MTTQALAGDDTGFSPIRVCEVELSHALPAIRAAAATGTQRYGAAMVLARWYTEPLALVDIPLPGEGATSTALASALWPAVRQAVAERMSAADRKAPPMLPAEGLKLEAPSLYLAGRKAQLATAPPVSVIVCTRDRAPRLPACLDALERQDYPDYEIILVDNAPTTDAVATLLARRRSPVPLRRVVEPRPGLSWARNTGLAAAAGQIVAYLDDDERPDTYWLAEITRGFTVAPGTAGVGGIILPAALETPAQCWFEQFGGHSKGRGFTAAIFDEASHAHQHPLYPLPPFGTGANMAFEREALTGIGGFDVALGAGTVVPGGEDTAAICDLMLSGATFVYWPGALTWHDHRREVSELARQLFGYGAGLTAFYTRALMRDPRAIGRLLRLAPQALHDLRGHDSVRTAAMGEDYPSELSRAHRRGMLGGAGAYLRSRRQQARQMRRTP